MRYVIVDDCGMDIYTEEVSNKQDAIKRAKEEWKRLTTSDKRRRYEFYVLRTVNPDKDAENHLDGDIVWRAKED